MKRNINKQTSNASNKIADTHNYMFRCQKDFEKDILKRLYNM